MVSHSKYSGWPHEREERINSLQGGGLTLGGVAAGLGGDGGFGLGGAREGHTGHRGGARSMRRMIGAEIRSLSAFLLARVGLTWR